MVDAARIEKFFKPKSIAIVGASPQRGINRNMVVRVAQKRGFKGPIYPVTPSHAEIEGLKAYPSVTDLPEAVDVALIITPASTVPGIIADCGRKGIRNAIVISSGFEEVESGKENARRLAEAAREHDVLVLGPNCQGIWSVADHTVLSFSQVALNLDSVVHAPIALISQSGALAGAMVNSLQASGTGCAYVVSVGNETCLDAIDVLDWLVDQDDVRVVGMYIEGLTDAGRLLPIAARARRRGVQIVALKAGRSDFGQQATASHTGKIASSHAVYSGVFEQAGVLAVESLADLMAALEALAYLPDIRSGTDAESGVAIMSSSGGAGALLADHASEANLPMAVFGDATGARLEKVLPDFARKANPIDLTGQITTVPTLFSDTCQALLADPRTEAIVIQFASSGKRNLADNAEVFKTVAREVPVILSFVADLPDRETRMDFRKAGVLLVADPILAIRALGVLYKRRAGRTLPDAAQRAALPARPAPNDWSSTMAFCADAGLTPAKWLVMKSGERAATACAALTYPLVVKVLPSESEHKTELGLVKLRVRTPEEVDAHAAEFRAKLGKPDAGILVQEMVGEGVEVVLACLRGTDFGPVISIGSGGVAIELYRDVVNLALPVTAEQVLVALQRLKLWTLLKGFRGKPPADVEALAAAAVRFGDQFIAATDVREFEVNPVIVRARGQGLAAVDALVTIGER